MRNLFGEITPRKISEKMKARSILKTRTRPVALIVSALAADMWSAGLNRSSLWRSLCPGISRMGRPTIVFRLATSTLSLIYGLSSSSNAWNTPFFPPGVWRLQMSTKSPNGFATATWAISISMWERFFRLHTPPST